jgi:2-methylaconitate cis-trans-isomerase PrpF
VSARQFASVTRPAPCAWAHKALQVNGEWTVTKAIMSRSTRILMEGWVRVPGDAF